MSRRHALICSPVLPEFDRESGSRRLFDFIEYLRAAGWMVSLVVRHGSQGERYIRLLQQRGVAVYVGFDTRVEQLIGAGRFDIAVLAFWHVAAELLPLIRRLSPGTPILVDSIDLHFLRKAREVFQRRSGNAPLAQLSESFAAELRKELNVYAAADGVLTVSRKEAELINDFIGDPSLAMIVPDAESLSQSPIPYHERKGILFVGNFRHAPNVGAAEYLCREIVPIMDPAILAEHPLSIVGNALNDTVIGYGRELAHVKMVGWVPSVIPYMNHARVKVIPLLYGAGTKRKLIQALMVGTPTVSTTIGTEGLQLQHEQHVLVADNPVLFARSIERLLTEQSLWEQLAAEGRQHITALHGPENAAERLLNAIEAVGRKPNKPAPPAEQSGAGTAEDAYPQLIRRIQELSQTVLPAGAQVLVVSKGDDRLLAMPGRTAAHFPQADTGGYSGHHPANGAEALDHLQKLRSQGSTYLLLPSTSWWWLDHYRELQQYLDTQCQQIHADDDCRIYDLTAAPSPTVVASASDSRTPEPRQAADEQFVERVRPTILSGAIRNRAAEPGQRILVYGVYVANQPNTADHVVSVMGSSRKHEVAQRWVGLFGEPPSARVDDVTVCQLQQKKPKFQILNELLAQEDLNSYDYVLLADDDIVLPDGFVDEYIALQAELDFAIAQPARTSNSYIDHPIVEQQRGVMARRTMFVEIGPVVSFHRSCYDLVFPFDLMSPMGWGYENVWSRRLATRGLRMGIIDAVPVDHSLRKPVVNYSWAEADRQRKALLAKQEHFPMDQCFRVLEVFGFQPSKAEETVREIAAY